MDMHHPSLKHRPIHHGAGFWLVLALVGICMLLVSTRVHAYGNTQSVNRTYLRAGPFTNFPVVAVIGPHQWVQLEGCLPDWTWCQVRHGHTVGWAPGIDVGVDRQGWVWNGEEVYWFDGPPIVPFYDQGFQSAKTSNLISQPQPYALRPTNPRNQEQIIDRTPVVPPVVVRPQPW